MSLTVNTNVSSLNAQRNVGKTQSELQKSLARLSSGLRINSAKDDAAGMAISNRMSAQIRGLDQAIRNANDGISLAQTAEGALGEVTTNLQRLRELSVQAANASNSADDRAALQNEARQLLDEIERIANQTEFNGTRLLDGSFSAQNFQIGANANQTLAISMNSANTSKLGVSNTAALTARGTGEAISEGDLIINGVTIRSSSAADDTASYPSSGKASSAIAKAAAINDSSDLTGVTARADVNVLEGATMKGADGEGKITLNGVKVSVAVTENTAASRAAVVEALNAVSGQTGVVAKDTGSDATGVTLTAADGRNITVQFEQTGGNLFDASNTGIRGLVANEVDGASMVAGNSSGVITINGVDTGVIHTTTSASDSRSNVVAAINAISSKTGVMATDSGSDAGGVQLTAADGRQIQLRFNEISGSFGMQTTGVQAETVATGSPIDGATNGDNTLEINGIPVTANLTGGDDPAYPVQQADVIAIANAINTDETLDAAGIKASQAFGSGTTQIGTATDDNGTTADLTIEYNGHILTASITTVGNEEGNAAAIVTALNEKLHSAGINDFHFANGDAAINIVVTAESAAGIKISSTVENLRTATGFTYDAENNAMLGNTVQITSAYGDALTFGGNLKNALGLEDVGNASHAASTEAGTDYGSYTLTSDNAIVIAAAAGAGANVSNAGLAAGTYASQTAYTSTTENNGMAITAGDAIINGVTLGASYAHSDSFSRYADTVDDKDALTAASAIAKVAAINAISEQTGVTATANATYAGGTDMSSGKAGTGTIVINGVETSYFGVAAVDGSSDPNSVATGSRSQVVAAINAISDQTGVKAVDTNSIEHGIQLVAEDGRNINVQFNNGLNSANTGIGGSTSEIALGGTEAENSAVTTGKITINGVETGIISTVEDNTTVSMNIVRNAINAITDQTGVTANIVDGGVELTSTDGVGISVSYGDGTTNELTAVSTGLAASGSSARGQSSTSFGTFTLSSAAEFTIEKGATASLDNTGLAVGTYGSGKSGMELSRIDISTIEGANKAMVALDNALKQIDESRSMLGAVQNRFEATISNLANVSENLSAARGRIVDADFAAETAALTKSQILQQAGVAMLAQANQLPQAVLSLLQ